MGINRITVEFHVISRLGAREFLPQVDDSGFTMASIDQLINQLDSPDVDAILEQLISIGPPAVGPLTRVLEDATWLARNNAAIALGKINDPSVITPLIRALQYYEYGVAHTAANALLQRGSSILDPLISALSDPNWAVRFRAVWMLGRMKEPRSLYNVKEALKDENATVRAHAALALSMFKEQSTISSLAGLICDEEPIVRLYAIRALKRVDAKDNQTKEAIYKLRNDSDMSVRKAASEPEN